MLLTDDDELFLETFNDILGSQGYTIFSANNPYTALQIVKNNKIDLAIIDYNLPYMTGTQLGHLVSKEQENMRIIFISGNPKIKELVKDVTYKVEEVISKPVNIEKLIALLNEISNFDIELDDSAPHMVPPMSYV